MANTKDSRRLDELVKQTLNNYEAASAASDWSKMEGLLGAAPKTVSSGFKVPSFSAEGAGLVKGIFSSYIFIIALMLAGGGYLLYTILKAPKPDTAISTALPADTLSDKPVAPPVITSPALSAPEAATADAEKSEIKDTVAVAKPEPQKVEKEEETKEAKEMKEEKGRKEKKEAELAEKKRLEREKSEAEKLKASEKKREEKREEAKKAEKKEKEGEKERALKAEKEKKEAPKETLKKSNKPIGLSNFLRSVNLDSIKKSQEQPAPAPPQVKGMDK